LTVTFMKFTLDGAAVDSRETLHTLLAAGLGLPVWYGKNLDALHDCLTDIREPVELTVINGNRLKDTLGPYAERLRRMLSHTADESDFLSLSWHE